MSKPVICIFVFSSLFRFTYISFRCHHRYYNCYHYDTTKYTVTVQQTLSFYPMDQMDFMNFSLFSLSFLSIYALSHSAHSTLLSLNLNTQLFFSRIETPQEQKIVKYNIHVYIEKDAYLHNV